MSCKCCGTTSETTIQKMEDKLNREIRPFKENDIHFKAPNYRKKYLEMHFYPMEKYSKSNSTQLGWKSKKNIKIN
ncbi:MAG: hypothetical protein MJ252_10860 [archaeon]|nr:hypothetical protein [archaeon]